MLAILAACGVTACSLVAGLGHHHLLEEGHEAGVADAVQDGSAPPAEDAEASVDAVLDAEDLPTADLLASGQVSPGMIVASASSVYWINEATAAGPGSIMRVSRTPGDTPTVIAADRLKPIALRLNPGTDNLYFTEDHIDPDVAGGIYGVRLDGGAVTTIDSSGAFGYGTLVIGTVNTFSEAYSLDASGGSVRRVNETPDTGVTCSTSSSVGRIRSFAYDNSGLYFYDDGAAAIMQGNTTCTTAPATVFAGGLSGVRSIVSFNGAIWWVTADAVYVLATTTPNGVPTKVASGYTDLVAVASSQVGVAFVDARAGNVYRMIGGIVQHIAKNQNDPRGVHIAADGSIYWTNHGSGEVWKVKP